MYTKITFISVSGMTVAIVSDSRLAFARFSDQCYLKPGREKTTPNVIDVRHEFQRRNIVVTQFAFSGLKAFDSHGSGEKDRTIFIKQLTSVYSRKSLR